MVLARDVVGFEARGPARAVLLEGRARSRPRAVIVASGVAYRRLGGRRGRRPDRAWRLLRRQRQRRRPVRGRRGLPRRRRQLGRPGGSQPVPVRRTRVPGGAGRQPRRLDVELPGEPDRGVPVDRGAASVAGGRRPRHRPPGGTHARRPVHGNHRGGAEQLALRVHRCGPADRLAGRRRGARRPRVRAHRAGAAGRCLGRGRCRARRTPSRRACPASSPRATCVWTR